MSFHFEFPADDEDESSGGGGDGHVAGREPSGDLPLPASIVTGTSTSTSAPAVSAPLSALLSSLPNRLSYSTVKVGFTTLPRRDLFDARFQMLCKGEEDIGVESDLIPGLYEGGLKTWECSLDLVAVLQKSAESMVYQGKRIVELGCGTALPSLYLLQHLLTTPPPTSTPTYLHLCDFNMQVLTLVTLPNLLLAFHFVASPHSVADAGEVEVTDELVDAFLSALEERQIHILFHAGPWEGLCLNPTSSPDDRYAKVAHPAQAASELTANLILTSETAYNVAAVATLIQVMRKISTPSCSLQDSHAVAVASAPTKSLIATKNYYFGLGGGLHALLAGLQEDSQCSGWKHTVCEEKAINAGVARSVLSISWSS